jgi:ribosomal protein L34E
MTSENSLKTEEGLYYHVIVACKICLCIFPKEFPECPSCFIENKKKEEKMEMIECNRLINGLKKKRNRLFRNIYKEVWKVEHKEGNIYSYNEYSVQSYMKQSNCIVKKKDSESLSPFELDEIFSDWEMNQ